MDVKDLLDDNDIPFIPRGADYLISCLNPEHEDKNPSLSVNNITGIFSCFSCGFKGNLFTHFDEKPNVLQNKKEALKSKIASVRAQSIGLEMPKGFVPYKGNWRDISPETYTSFEAFQHNDPDFIGRVVFPIRDIGGRICAFQGRHLGMETPKYKIVPHKVRIPLYPTVEPIKGSIVLVEGLFDAINLHDKGLMNAVSAFGTSTVTRTKLSILAMQGIQEIVVFFDGDEAGIKGSEKVRKLCEELNITTRNVCFDNQDPGGLSLRSVSSLRRKIYGI